MIMKITSIKKYKGSSYEVTVDDERKIYLHIDIIHDFHINIGSEFDDEQLEEIIYSSNRRKAYQYSLYLLDYRDYSYRELFKKLLGIYKNEDLCFEVMDKLVKGGMINDRRYAENLARKYIEIKKFGINRARREMYNKGIMGEVAETALEPYSGYAEENISELLEKKYSRYLADPDDRKNTEKVKNSLVRLGYSFDDINKSIDNYFENRKDF
ncbi:MAG: RecX family transcriptional regulator [Ruminococcus sp.]|nr:RecX family transcriptional regulator [Oscillospiraceae bacterium]MDY4413652.1 RecX family transcriptional regulator [Ruminococcus sp.]